MSARVCAGVHALNQRKSSLFSISEREICYSAKMQGFMCVCVYVCARACLWQWARTLTCVCMPVLGAYKCGCVRASVGVCMCAHERVQLPHASLRARVGKNPYFAYTQVVV